MSFCFLPCPFITLPPNSLSLIKNTASYFFTFSLITKAGEAFCVRHCKLGGKGSQRTQNYSESFRRAIETILWKKNPDKTMAKMQEISPNKNSNGKPTNLELKLEELRNAMANLIFKLAVSYPVLPLLLRGQIFFRYMHSLPSFLDHEEKAPDH